MMYNKIWRENDQYKKSKYAKSNKSIICHECFMTEQKIKDANSLKELIEKELGIKMKVIRRRDSSGKMLNVFLSTRQSLIKVQKYIWNIDQFTNNKKYFDVTYYCMDIDKAIFE